MCIRDSSNIAPPGYYMLFILNGNGVPSVAKIVQIIGQSQPDPTSTPITPTSTTQSGTPKATPIKPSATHSNPNETQVVGGGSFTSNIVLEDFNSTKNTGV